MKNTNLTVRIEYITSDVAENYLKFNINNRSTSLNNLNELVHAMKSDMFLENGESIVFDENGVLKNGQHRLQAIVISKKCYNIPVVRGVKSKTMSTFDTGKNRSAADVLSLNGFKNTNKIAAFISSFDKFTKNKSKASNLRGKAKSNKKSNQEILEFCQYNYDWISDIVKNANNLRKASTPPVLSENQIAVVSYILGGKKPSKNVYEFMKHLTGIKRSPETATNYIFTKLYNSKVNKEPLNFYWLLGMIIKAYNYYNEGNPAVKYFKFSFDSDLPIINKYNE